MKDQVRARCVASIGMLGIICIVAGSTASADTHPAMLVPRNSAAFVVFPQISKSNQHIKQFVRRTMPSFVGFDESELEMTLGFAPGTIDLSKPVIVIADRPEELKKLMRGVGLSEGNVEWPAVGFQPVDPERFRAKIVGGERSGADGVQTIVGAYGRYRVVMRDGYAFVAPKTTTLARIARMTREDSEWSRMSDEARDDALKSEVFIQLSMSAWRPLFEGQLQAIIPLMKYGIQMQQQDLSRIEQTRKLADWFFDGALDGLRQMDTASLALSMDAERVRVSHHHSFQKRGWVADYLERVTVSGDASNWRAFPDRPFLIGLSMNWIVPSENSLTVRFNRRCMDDPALCRTLSKRDRQLLDRDLCRLTQATMLEEFVVTSDSGELTPLRVFGSYSASQAPQILEIMRKVRDHSNEMIGAVIPGAADIGGKARPLALDGMTVYRMHLVDGTKSQIVRDNIAAMYGANALYQEAAVDDKTIIYAIGDRKSIRELADVVRGKSDRMSANPRVRKAMNALPANANVYALVDTNRLAKSIPAMIRSGMADPRVPGRITADTDRTVDSVGPLLGWTARVRGHHVCCAFDMTKDDLEETIGAIMLVKEQLKDPTTGGATMDSGFAKDRPLPFVMGD